MRSKYDTNVYRMGSAPELDLMKRNNRVSWEKVQAVFRRQKSATYMELKDATAGHEHGSVSHQGRDSGSFVRYCHRMEWIKPITTGEG